MAAAQSMDRSRRESRQLRIHDQDRDALVLVRTRVGAAGEPDVIGAVRTAGEDLGSVHHEEVALAHGPRLERGEVGARAGFGVADREVDLAGQNAGQEAPLLRLAPARDQGRADRVERDEGQGGAGAPRLFGPDLLLDGGAPLAAPFPGPAHAEPAVGAHLPDQAALERAAFHRPDLGVRTSCGISSAKYARSSARSAFWVGVWSTYMVRRGDAESIRELAIGSPLRSTVFDPSDRRSSGTPSARRNAPPAPARPRRNPAGSAHRESIQAPDTPRRDAGRRRRRGRGRSHRARCLCRAVAPARWSRARACVRFGDREAWLRMRRSSSTPDCDPGLPVHRAAPRAGSGVGGSRARFPRRARSRRWGIRSRSTGR